MKPLRLLAASLATVAAVASLRAPPLYIDFTHPNGDNAVQFHLDSLLEPISGTAKGVSGTVSFDPAAPAATTGKIVVATNSLQVANDMMIEHLHGERWLDAASHPEIAFELTKLTDVKTAGDTTKATAHGKFTLHGVTKEISVPVSLTYLPDALGKRTRPENKGDLLVVRGEFTVSRSDYGINPGQMTDKVAEEIKLSFGLVGSAPKA